MFLGTFFIRQGVVIGMDIVGEDKMDKLMTAINKKETKPSEKSEGEAKMEDVEALHHWERDDSMIVPTETSRNRLNFVSMPRVASEQRYIQHQSNYKMCACEFSGAFSWVSNHSKISRAHASTGGAVIAAQVPRAKPRRRRVCHRPAARLEV